ncbi:MAG: hypothetical protein HOO00_08035 [Rhodospirillaceae bacterium]|nr:hypothetical protein [Rhodospirillaceae bacterium]MBT5373934.1 hypothetical protein [Rhodospirillaceae bacterium]MBT5659851.1 hypothetical protein [Rhodospirillaceae bacterium]MBT5753031.1 hypothetical protein [Rhodospirillaceae bacterium]
MKLFHHFPRILLAATAFCGLSALLIVSASAPAVAGEKAAEIDFTPDESNPYSEANIELFSTNHLESIDVPTEIIYDFEHKGSLDNEFKGRVLVLVTKVLPSGRKNLSFKFLSGKRKVRFPSYKSFTGNPLFMLFLERDAREMQKMTGGNALFFRNRVRHALAGLAHVTPINFPFEGKTVDGKEIRVKPFTRESLALFEGTKGLEKRFLRFINKEYIVVTSPNVPGGIYSITATTPSENEGDPLSVETVNFVGTEVIIREALKGENWFTKFINLFKSPFKG